MARLSIATAIAALASSASAAVSTACPLPSLCFRLEVPDAALASATGNILLQISGPTTYRYPDITLAHHNEKRHDYFRVVPHAGSSDVTVDRIVVNSSPNQVNCTGTVERLPSSSVKDRKVTADIRCSTCDSKSGDSMDLSAPVKTWDWTYRVTNASGHTLEYGAIEFDPPTGGLLTQLKSLHLPLVNRRAAPVGHAGGFGPPPRIIQMAMAHGVLACIAWALVFPLSGILVRLCSFHNLLWVHVGLQILGLCLYTASVGLGIELGRSPRHRWIKDKHAIIGLAVYILFLTQAASGYIHHIMFKKYISRTTWSYIHLWTGRLCITLGMINAGFGFQLRKQNLGSWKVMLYTVCAVLMWCAYVSSIVIGEWRRNKQMKKATSSIGLSPADSVVDMPTVQEIPKQV